MFQNFPVRMSWFASSLIINNLLVSKSESVLKNNNYCFNHGGHGKSGFLTTLSLLHTGLTGKTHWRPPDIVVDRRKYRQYFFVFPFSCVTSFIRPTGEDELVERTRSFRSPSVDSELGGDESSTQQYMKPQQ